MTDNESKRSLALALIQDTRPTDLVPIQIWAEGLLLIAQTDQSRFKKARSAIDLTLASKVVWPFVKLAAAKVKKVGWDERTSSARLGLVGAGAGLALFGGQGAGIAALGTAIGVPLWIVLGAGASFAGVLVDEIKRAKLAPTKSSDQL